MQVEELGHITAGAAHAGPPLELECDEVPLPLDVELLEAATTVPELLVDPTPSAPPLPPLPGAALKPLPHAPAEAAIEPRLTTNQGNAAARIEKLPCKWRWSREAAEVDTGAATTIPG